MLLGWFRHCVSLSLRQLVIVLMVCIADSAVLHAQATAAAQRTGDLSVFGLYTRLTPDYGPQQNNGVIFGVDYTRNVRWWVQPSVEFRAKIAKGATADEKTFGGGIRAVKTINKFTPYADFMISQGSINFHLADPPLLADGTPYTSDTSIVYSYGGGLDYHITGNFSARGDFQFERWRLDKYVPAIYKPIDLAPTGWSLGVVYRIPFGRR
jgi:hypothetical protein